MSYWASLYFLNVLTFDPEFPRAPVPAYILLNSLPLLTHMERNISTNRETILGLSFKFKSINWYCNVSIPKNVWTQFVLSRQSVQLVRTVPYCCLKLAKLSKIIYYSFIKHQTSLNILFPEIEYFLSYLVTSDPFLV